MTPHPSLERTDHRPWALPDTRWTWRQRWCDLLFAHWPVAASAVRPFIPAGLEVDEFEGTSWVGLVPFRMEGVMLRPLPDMPFVSAFPELNLRLYVKRDGRPGVWFISLDATNPLAVWAARKFFDLPYFRAAMALRETGGRFHYASERAGAPHRIAFRGVYGPTSEVYAARKGTLEHFLTERYCLYAERPDGRLRRLEVHHVPWPLQQASVVIEENTIGERQGIRLEGPPALLHFSKSLDVIIFPAQDCG